MSEASAISLSPETVLAQMKQNGAGAGNEAAARRLRRRCGFLVGGF
ncbi:MAG TPA: hypothetical protein VNF04_06930 [Stellaceae bacterium]|nr:hypothetical protein [Stellaceae bacterium]